MIVVVQKVCVFKVLFLLCNHQTMPWPLIPLQCSRGWNHQSALSIGMSQLIRLDVKVLNSLTTMDIIISFINKVF